MPRAVAASRMCCSGWTHAIRCFRSRRILDTSRIRAASILPNGPKEEHSMSNSMIALSTPISPRFEATGDGRLAGCAVPRADLSPRERAEMYQLFEEYFAGTSRAQFETDLAEKETVVLLRAAGDPRIQGFSTLMRLEAGVEGRGIVAF